MTSALFSMLLAVQSFVPVDTGWKVATNNTPNQPIKYAVRGARWPARASRGELCLSMQHRMTIHVHNGSSTPAWLSFDQSMRNELHLDPWGLYRVWNRTAGHTTVIPQADALQPGETRDIEIDAQAGTICLGQNVEWWALWGMFWVSFDAYYPAVFSLRGQFVDPQDPSAWESQGITVWVAYYHGVMPEGRLVGTARFE